MMKNFKIGTRLSIAFISIIFLVILSSVFSFFDINKINNSLKNELTQSFQKLELVLRIEAESNTLAYSQLASSKAATEENKKLFASFADRARKKIDEDTIKLIAKINKNQITEKSVVDKMIASKSEFESSLQQMEQVTAKDIIAGEEFFQKYASPKWANFQENQKEVLTFYEKQFEKDKAQIISNNQNSIVIIGIKCLFVVLLSSVLSYFITRSITTPITEAVYLSKEIADGRFKYLNQNRDFGKSEPEELLKSIYTVNNNFRSIITQLHQTASQVQNAAAEISSCNQDLSSRTEEQAASLEETAATMEELTATIQQTSENAHYENSLATGLSKSADEGITLVKDVSSKVHSIKESSDKIEDIISVINNIAFQTNLLALNAAVEAARAGEHGRGFAVVASEVRALSQQCAQAAKEIKELILDSKEKVTESVSFTNTVTERIIEISEGFKKVSSIVEQINISATEQAHSVVQINVAISQMDQMTQQNASLVEEAAAASASLYQQSNELKAIVDKFKVY